MVGLSDRLRTKTRDPMVKEVLENTVTKVKSCPSHFPILEYIERIQYSRLFVKDDFPSEDEWMTVENDLDVSKQHLNDTVEASELSPKSFSLLLKEGENGLFVWMRKIMNHLSLAKVSLESCAVSMNNLSFPAPAGNAESPSWVSYKSRVKNCLSRWRNMAICINEFPSRVINSLNKVLSEPEFLTTLMKEHQQLSGPLSEICFDPSKLLSDRVASLVLALRSDKYLEFVLTEKEIRTTVKFLNVLKSMLESMKRSVSVIVVPWSDIAISSSLKQVGISLRPGENHGDVVSVGLYNDESAISYSSMQLCNFTPTSADQKLSNSASACLASFVEQKRILESAFHNIETQLEEIPLAMLHSLASYCTSLNGRVVDLSTKLEIPADVHDPSALLTSKKHLDEVIRFDEKAKELSDFLSLIPVPSSSSPSWKEFHSLKKQAHLVSISLGVKSMTLRTNVELSYKRLEADTVELELQNSQKEAEGYEQALSATMEAARLVEESLKAQSGTKKLIGDTIDTDGYPENFHRFIRHDRAFGDAPMRVSLTVAVAGGATARLVLRDSVKSSKSEEEPVVFLELTSTPDSANSGQCVTLHEVIPHIPASLAVASVLRASPSGKHLAVFGPSGLFVLEVPSMSNSTWTISNSLAARTRDASVENNMFDVDKASTSETNGDVVESNIVSRSHRVDPNRYRVSNPLSRAREVRWAPVTAGLLSLFVLSGDAIRVYSLDQILSSKYATSVRDPGDQSHWHHDPLCTYKLPVAVPLSALVDSQNHHLITPLGGNGKPLVSMHSRDPEVESTPSEVDIDAILPAEPVSFAFSRSMTSSHSRDGTLLVSTTSSFVNDSASSMNVNSKPSMAIYILCADGSLLILTSISLPRINSTTSTSKSVLNSTLSVTARTFESTGLLDWIEEKTPILLGPLAVTPEGPNFVLGLGLCDPDGVWAEGLPAVDIAVVPSTKSTDSYSASISSSSLISTQSLNSVSSISGKDNDFSETIVVSTSAGRLITYSVGLGQFLSQLHVSLPPMVQTYFSTSGSSVIHSTFSGQDMKINVNSLSGALADAFNSSGLDTFGFDKSQSIGALAKDPHSVVHRAYTFSPPLFPFVAPALGASPLLLSSVSRLLGFETPRLKQSSYSSILGCLLANPAPIFLSSPTADNVLLVSSSRSASLLVIPPPPSLLMDHSDTSRGYDEKREDVVESLVPRVTAVFPSSMLPSSGAVHRAAASVKNPLVIGVTFSRKLRCNDPPLVCVSVADCSPSVGPNALWAFHSTLSSSTSNTTGGLKLDKGVKSVLSFEAPLPLLTTLASVPSSSAAKSAAQKSENAAEATESPVRIETSSTDVLMKSSELADAVQALRGLQIPSYPSFTPSGVSSSAGGVSVSPEAVSAFTSLESVLSVLLSMRDRFESYSAQLSQEEESLSALAASCVAAVDIVESSAEAQARRLSSLRMRTRFMQAKIERVHFTLRLLRPQLSQDEERLATELDASLALLRGERALITPADVGRDDGLLRAAFSSSERGKIRLVDSASDIAESRGLQKEDHDGPEKDTASTLPERLAALAVRFGKLPVPVSDTHVITEDGSKEEEDEEGPVFATEATADNAIEDMDEIVATTVRRLDGSEGSLVNAYIPETNREFEAVSSVFATLEHFSKTVDELKVLEQNF